MSTMHHHPHHHHGHLSEQQSELLKCKKRANFNNKMQALHAAAAAAAVVAASHSQVPPTSVARRNERERNRVKMVNLGFATLRQHVPNGAKNKKMSKVETLRSAVEYIRQLQKVLGQTTDSSFLSEPYGNSIPSTSGDENCYPMSSSHLNSMLPSPIDPNGSDGLESDQPQHIFYASSMPFTSMSGSLYSSSSPSSELSPMAGTTAAIGKLNTYGQLCSPPSMGARNTPSPSIASDITSSSASPYNNRSLLEGGTTITTTTVATSGAPATLSSSQTVLSTEDELFDFANWF